MAYFAKIESNKVLNVIVAEQYFIDSGTLGDPESWIETSIYTLANVHYGVDGQPDGGTPLRGNYAIVGCIYDSENDVFYPEKIHNSWIINETTWTWEAPVAMPLDAGTGTPPKYYNWDEATVNWVEVVTP